MVETQAAKVDRLIETGAVSKQLELPDGGSVWRINGDAGTYRLTIDDVGVEWQCTCPAALRGRKDCAHAWAVLKVMGLDPPEVELVPVDMPVQDIDRGSMKVVEPHAAVMADKANHDALDDEDLDDEDLDDTFDDDLVEVVGDDAPRALASTDQRRDLIALAKVPVTWQTIISIQDTDFVPGALRHKPYAILAAMLLGRDWGLGELESLRMIDVIDGRPAPSAEMSLRLYRRAGHSLEVHQDDDRAVTITGKRADTGETLKVSFTIEDAEQAGLITISDNQVKARSARGNKMPWELYTNDLLWARAVTRLVRRLAPDALDQPLEEVLT